jgi:hypothetical protein
MSNLSQFAPFAGGGLNSYQTGYISVTPSSGSGEDTLFSDVTVSSVNTNKTLPSFVGSASNSGAMRYFAATSNAQAIVSARMTSATNLRLATSVSLATPSMTGRWYLAEAA